MQNGSLTLFSETESIAYLYDGTVEGLLSAIFLSYVRREQPIDVVRESNYQPRLDQNAVVVNTDFEWAKRVRKGVIDACGSRAFTAIMRASTCDSYDTGTIVYRFVRYAMERARNQRRKSPIMDELATPEVRDLARLEKHAMNECERMKQFVRFSHLENGVWFARVSPNASVVPLVMGYFASRLNDQPFIIFDEAHGISGVYDAERWHLVAADVVHAPEATDQDTLMQEAWKRFYDALCIDARYNPELRRHFMPVRLWNNLPEMAPRTKPTP